MIAFLKHNPVLRKAPLKSRKWYFISTLILLISGAEFAARGPIRYLRAAQNWNDFLSPYIQSNAWRQGLNPYSSRDLVSMWPTEITRPSFVTRDAADGTLAKKRGIPTPYPLTALVVLSPLTVLHWKAAELLWSALSTVLVLALLFLLPTLYKPGPLDARKQLFFGIALLLAPIHTGLATANPAMSAIGLCALALWTAQRGKLRAGGLLLGLAICIKPPIGACLLLYLLVRREWKVVATALVVVSAVMLVGVWRMNIARIPWLSSYIECSRQIFQPGSLADFTGADPVRFSMVDLRILVYALFGSVSLAQMLPLLCGAVLLAVWLYQIRMIGTTSELLTLSALFTLSLLPVYHRFYDATLLVWPLCWTILVARQKTVRTVAIILILPFLAPGGALLQDLGERGYIRASIAGSWWWQAIVLPHENWSLLFLCLLLIYSLHSTKFVLPNTKASETEQLV